MRAMSGSVVEVLWQRGAVTQAVEVWCIDGGKVVLKVILYLDRTKLPMRFGDVVKHEAGDPVASWFPRGRMDQLPIGVRVVGAPKLVAG